MFSAQRPHALISTIRAASHVSFTRKRPLKTAQTLANRIFICTACLLAGLEIEVPCTVQPLHLRNAKLQLLEAIDPDPEGICRRWSLFRRRLVIWTGAFVTLPTHSSVLTVSSLHIVEITVFPKLAGLDTKIKLGKEQPRVLMHRFLHWEISSPSA